MQTDTPPARVNEVPLHPAGEILPAEELRQRACSELLRQAALARGLLPASDLPATDGILSEAASQAIEALLAQEIRVPEPPADECRRYHAAHQAFYATGERVNARHLLFAVTPGVDVVALRNLAETTLLDLRCHDGSTDKFAQAASRQSNCPSGAEGGHLGWLSATDCAPEFAREIFGQAGVGVLPRLVHSRSGFHVVEILAREPGVEQPFEAVRGAVVMAMRQKAHVNALRSYLRQLAAGAALSGVDLETADGALGQ
ncbi:MAG: peptidylprolyl isomerase [Candidatus Accumulibacter sp. UW26]|jgi:peptidyl-prolyl cis-trans isomerase C